MENKNGSESLISQYFGRSNFFAIVVLREGKISSLEFVENPFKEKPLRKGLLVSKFLIEKKPDILITKEIGPISFHTLRDNLIQIYKAKGKKIREIINNFLSSKLKKIEKPTRTKE